PSAPSPGWCDRAHSRRSRSNDRHRCEISKAYRGSWPQYYDRPARCSATRSVVRGLRRIALGVACSRGSWPMKRVALSAVCILAAIAAANADTPEQVWKASLVQANVDWAKKPHAILKIQDAAYLGEGQSATLTGMKGKPFSYRWAAGTKAKGVLMAS